MYGCGWRDRRFAGIDGQGVELSDHTPDVHLLPSSRALASNQIAREIRATDSLAAVENAIRAAGRASEIAYERRKAANGRPANPAVPKPGALESRAFGEDLAHIRDDVARRGIDFITLRGLAERLGIPGSRLADLQHHLAATTHPGEYTPPLWTVRP